MKMQDAPVIECINLNKAYGRIRALSNLNLTVHQGESFGLLGENGAGKSSLVRLLMGFTFPSSGELRLFDDPNLGRARQRIGYLPEQPQYDRQFSAVQYLGYLGRLAGVPRAQLRQRIADLLELVGLTPAADRHIGGYSKGMTQRVGIAAALIHKPALLILDEPSAGLDPGGQWDIRNILARLRAEGVTMLLCSHQLVEVEDLCDTVGILRKGELVRSGAVADLLNLANLVEIVADAISTTTLTRLQAMELDTLDVDGNRLVVPVAASQRVLQTLLEEGARIVSMNPLRRSLQDVYLQVSRGVPTKVPTRPAR
ncbi:MAG: ABC transporter ATP-binding protein [Candidatus Chloroheliales bacterium]|nr:MAG: ABC transporter ATP-binding protein [Chloroflexota bacterium]